MHMELWRACYIDYFYTNLLKLANSPYVPQSSRHFRELHQFTASCLLATFRPKRIFIYTKANSNKKRSANSTSIINNLPVTPVGDRYR